MRAVEVSKFGPPDVLRMIEVARPPINDDEVRVCVKAIGINFADIFARLGYYPAIPKPPFIPGLEFAGVVDEAGKSVKGLRPGTRVLGFTRLKGYAEYVSVPAQLLTRMPARMSFEEAAAMGVAFLTAYHGLVTLGQIRKGECLLLHAAAGGVGTVALQIARHLGAHTYATVGSPSKMQTAIDLGAELVIDYSEEDFAEIIRRQTKGLGVDIVLDSVGGKVMRKSWKLLAPMGRYVLYGFAAVADRKGVPKLKAMIEAAAVPILYPPSLVSKNVTFAGFNLYFLFDKFDYLREAMEIMMDWHKKGIVRPVIGGVYPFDKIREAQEFLQSRRSIGKVVVTMERG
jgi:NADPH:quinone reductase-like Zn-dependent oxidoreductase